MYEFKTFKLMNVWRLCDNYFFTERLSTVVDVIHSITFICQRDTIFKFQIDRVNRTNILGSAFLFHDQNQFIYLVNNFIKNNMDLLSCCESEFDTRDLYAVFGLSKYSSIEDGRINSSQRWVKDSIKNLLYFSEKKLSQTRDGLPPR